MVAVEGHLSSKSLSKFGPTLIIRRYTPFACVVEPCRRQLYNICRKQKISLCGVVKILLFHKIIRSGREPFNKRKASVVWIAFKTDRQDRETSLGFRGGFRERETSLGRKVKDFDAGGKRRRENEPQRRRRVSPSDWESRGFKIRGPIDNRVLLDRR